MDITQLIYFKIIAETGSLTKAAQQLHISQPAMSAMLKKFEEELGAELFDRSPNRITLNEAGETALRHADRILKDVEQMREDVLNVARKTLTLSVAFCDPGVQLYSVPRFSVACPEIHLKEEMYDGENAAKLLHKRVYDIMVTPRKIADSRIQSVLFLSDQVYLSVPEDSILLSHDSISLREIPEQPLLYPQIGGYFLKQMERIIAEEHLPITLVKNNFNVTQHLVQTTNFLATVSTLSMELRNDGTHRRRIPMNDPELNVQYYLSFLKTNRQKIGAFLRWGKVCRESWKRNEEENYQS